MWKLANLVLLFGFLSLLLGCSSNEEAEPETAVPATHIPTLIVFYTDN